jgi:ATP-dependent Clp protease ATP-binding subunit ClpA
LLVSGHFSDRTRRAVELAQVEALELGHLAISDGHLLLGLLHARRGLAARVLRRHGIELEASRAALSAGRPRSAADQTPPLPLELSAKRALQLALHEAFERNDGPIRAVYLLVATISVEGAAANLIRAQAVSPSEFLDAVRRKLPGPDRERGTELLESRLATLDAYLRGAERHEELTQIVSNAADRETAVREIAGLLNLSETQAYAVGDMPRDMTTRGGLAGLEAERQDLKKRLDSIRPSES